MGGMVGTNRNSELSKEIYNDAESDTREEVEAAVGE